MGGAHGNGGRGDIRRSGRKLDQRESGGGGATRGVGGKQRETEVGRIRQKTVVSHQADHIIVQVVYSILIVLPTAAAGSNVYSSSFLFSLFLFEF